MKYASMLQGDQKVAQFMDGKNIKEGTDLWYNYAQSIRDTQVVSLQLQLTNEALYKSLSPKEADIAKQLDSAGIERYSAAWYNLAAQIRATQQETQTFAFGAKTAFQTITDDANNYAASSSQIVNDMYNGLQDVWVEFARTGKLSFSSLIDTMLTDLARLEYKMVMSGLLNSIGGGSGASTGTSSLFANIAGFVGRLFGGGLADTTGGTLYNAMGNAFNDNGVARFANGGSFSNSVVTRPTSFRYGGGRRGEMGEAGPEAVMPLTRTSDGRLGVSSANQNGGGVNVTIVDQRTNAPQVEQRTDNSGNLRFLIRDEVNRTIGSGDADKSLGGRMGARPVRTKR